MPLLEDDGFPTFAKPIEGRELSCWHALEATREALARLVDIGEQLRYAAAYVPDLIEAPELRESQEILGRVHARLKAKGQALASVLERSGLEAG